MKCVDLFSGCGGMSLGFIQAGFDVVAGIDNWPDAAKVYNKNFTHPCYQFDLNDEIGCLEIIKRYNPDFVIGGPPCQDFSTAGKRDESLGRADLTYKFANIISGYKPKWFVMENVERIRVSHILSDISEQLIEEGYGLTPIILDASLCGVPQVRKRFFLIGELYGGHNRLTKVFMKNLSKSPLTIREYLGDSLGCEYYYRHPRSYLRRGIFSIDEPSPTIRGVNRPVPPGYKKHSGDPVQANLNEIRPLTTLERAFLQTFPKSFVFDGAKTSLEQMIGNAVPVNLAKFVARGIKEYIDGGNIYSAPSTLFGDLDFCLPNKVLTRSH